MAQVTEGLDVSHGELERWAVKRSDGADAAEVRISRWTQYPGTVRFMIRVEGASVGPPQYTSINLELQHIRELIGDLQDVLTGPDLSR